jgi:hypothetical protein
MNFPKYITDRCRIITNQQNPHHPRVEEIKPLLKPCEDCGAMVDRKEEINLLQMPYPHWRRYCKGCSRYQNPDTGVFEFSDSKEINQYMRTKKRRDDK